MPETLQRPVRHVCPGVHQLQAGSVSCVVMCWCLNTSEPLVLICISQIFFIIFSSIFISGFDTLSQCCCQVIVTMATAVVWRCGRVQNERNRWPHALYSYNKHLITERNSVVLLLDHLDNFTAQKINRFWLKLSYAFLSMLPQEIITIIYYIILVIVT